MPSTKVSGPIFLFDNPRTCSQLLHRFFSAHPELETAKGYHWITAAATNGPERIQLRVEASERAKAADQDLQRQARLVFGPLGMDFDKETYKVAADRLKGVVDETASEGSKILLVKDHVACSLRPDVMGELLRTGDVANPPANPTAIPDDIFVSIERPLFLIRHPALVVESQWRAQVHFAYDPDDEGFRFFTSPRSTRLLYDQLRSKDPVVINAEDVVYRSEALCERLCQLWGIDPAGVRYTWEKAPKNDGAPQHPGRPYFFGTLDDSVAPIRPPRQAVDIESKHAEWKDKFGTAVADGLRRRVDADLVDYEYLEQYRLQLS